MKQWIISVVILAVYLVIFSLGIYHIVHKLVSPKYSLEAVRQQIPFSFTQVILQPNEFIIESEETGFIYKVILQKENPKQVEGIYVWRGK